MPQIADASTMPGISPPGWISRWGRAVSLTAGKTESPQALQPKLMAMAKTALAKLK